MQNPESRPDSSGVEKILNIILSQGLKNNEHYIIDK